MAGFTDPTSLGILKPAGDAGADFVVGEGQSFGNPMNYGGPYLGILASTDAFLRKIPGRLVGATVDREGCPRLRAHSPDAGAAYPPRKGHLQHLLQRGALHARRGCLPGKPGKEPEKAGDPQRLEGKLPEKRLAALPGWKPLFSGPVYNEFALACPDARTANTRLEAAGYTGGYDLSKDYPELDGGILLCATEMLRREDMDSVADLLK